MGTNLVTIAIDDLFAYDQFRTSFGVTIQTPNLDRLMGQSVNFENAYASVAICAPSRAATMSGKTAFETGVHDNFTPLFSVVDPSETWPAMIRDNGYFATASGKVFHSKGGTGGVQDAYSEPIVVTKSTLTGERALTEGGKKWAYLGEDADLADHDVATFAIDFLGRAPTDQPFLLTLGFDHPHTAYFAPARYFDLYAIDQIKVPDSWLQGDLSDVPAFAQQFVSQPRGGEPFADLDAWKATVQGYLASISHMDAQVGRFLDALAESDHAANTAILLYSDHGYQLGAKDHPVKFTLWEESAKAPLMLYHPDQTGPKTVTLPVSLMDIMPTVLEITGTDVPDGLIGQSLLSFAMGNGGAYREKPVLTTMYGSFAIRSGDFRYIRYQDGSEELYDLASDPSQTDNLAADPAYVAITGQLRTALVQTAREAGALFDPDAVRVLGTDESDQGVAAPGNAEIALGMGDDVYFVYGTATEIVEREGEGSDTVYYIGTEAYRLPDHVERVYATLPDNRVGEVSITGNAGNNELHTGYIRGVFDGGAGDDRLFGGGWVSHDLYGGTGDDSVIGAKQADLLYGGAGDDKLQGWNKADQIFGGDGFDTIFGGNDNDVIYGGAGRDTVFGEAGADNLFGGVGADILSGGLGHDRVDGGAGADTILGGAGDDSLSGGDGNDTLRSTGGSDHLFGGQGDDLFVISAAAGHRVLYLSGEAGQGADRIEIQSDGLAAAGLVLSRISDALLLEMGTDWSLWIDGVSSQSDTVVLLPDGAATVGELSQRAEPFKANRPDYGDESITGTSLDDWFIGHVGRDTYAAKSGDDVLYGGDGDDALNGAKGDDLIFGGAGDDDILGGNGADVIQGGRGQDRLSGGAGGDTYVYNVGNGSDVIEDKGYGIGDSLTLAGLRRSDVRFTEDGKDLLVVFVDQSVITVRDHFAPRGAIEHIVFADVALASEDLVLDTAPPPPSPPADPGTWPSPKDDGRIQGTLQGERLFGSAYDDVLSDGGGRDNLFGGAGADSFAMSLDGEADSIKDFEIDLDRIDLRPWGVLGLGDLEFSAANGRVSVRFGDEILSIADTERTLSEGDLTAANFVFAQRSDGDPIAKPQRIAGTDGADKVFGTALHETLVDGAGRDNLFGGAGADVFEFVADGVADAVKDFDPSDDKLDVSAWGADDASAIQISDNGAGKVVVRFDGEVVSLANQSRLLTAADLTLDMLVL